MSSEQLSLKGFENIPVVDSGMFEVATVKEPRHPMIGQIATIYGSDSLYIEGLDWFDDGEDRFLLALDIEERYERMLLAKVDINDGWYRFTKGNGLLVEALYTENTDRLLGTSCYIVDLSKLNGAGEENDWISFFWVKELDDTKLSGLLVEEVDEKLLLERTRAWWALGPFDAKR